MCIVAFLIGYKKPHLKTGLIFLTSGKMPFFMLAEPIVLLAAVVAFVFSLVKSRKKASKTAGKGLEIMSQAEVEIYFL